MLIHCPNCDSGHDLPEGFIPASGAVIRCPRCGASFSALQSGLTMLISSDKDTHVHEPNDLAHEQSVRNQSDLDSEINPKTIKQIKTAYTKWYDDNERYIPDTDRIYENARDVTSKLDFLLEDALAFFEGHEFEGPFLEIFTSALVKDALLREDPRKAESHRFRSTELDKFFREDALDKVKWILNHCEFQHNENLKKFKRGTVIIRGGNADLYELAGGTIYVECETKGTVCFRMKGGMVILSEIVTLADGKLGLAMQNGEIIVEGDFFGESLGSSMEGGTIRIKGNVGGSRKQLTLQQSGWNAPRTLIQVEC